MKHKDTFKRTSLVWLYFALVAVLILVIVTLIMSAVMFLLFRRGDIPLGPAGMFPLDFMIILGAILGTVVAILVIKQIFKPIERLSKGLRRVSTGDFSVRLKEKSMFAAIREMYGDFNAMAKELAGVETLRSDFVSNVSHEFKTPLAAIEGYATLLQDKNLSSDKAQEYLEKIISNAHKLSILTGNILNLSKLENQNNVPNRKPFDLSEQIRKTILMLESAWEEKNISFDLSLPDIQYSRDAGMLFHVWYNLIGNAIKFSEKNSAIRIDLRTAENKVYVTIEDHGCGIDEQTLPHIFEKFYQGDTSHSADGNGLGLALVKRIVILCGGEILVKSEKKAVFLFLMHIETKGMRLLKYAYTHLVFGQHRKDWYAQWAYGQPIQT